MSSIVAAARRVALYPEPVLRAKAAAISLPSSASVGRLVADMLMTIQQHQGLGLAAPQVSESCRLFIMRVPTAWNEKEARRQPTSLRRALSHRPVKYVACANPIILSKLAEEEVAAEGCLSIPDYPCLVRRASTIEVEYTDLTPVELPGGGAQAQADLEGAAPQLAEPERVRVTLSGLPAVVFQHELDHLDGILITDRRVLNLGNMTEEDAMAEASRRFEQEVFRYYSVRAR